MRIKDMTVEDIIKLWNDGEFANRQRCARSLTAACPDRCCPDLQDHIRAFTDQANEIKQFDDRLVANGRKIGDLVQASQGFPALSAGSHPLGVAVCWTGAGTAEGAEPCVGDHQDQPGGAEEHAGRDREAALGSAHAKGVSGRDEA
jgi:hypothetical protein